MQEETKEKEELTEEQRAKQVKPPKPARGVTILRIALFVLLLGSLAYSITMICLAPSSSQTVTTKSSYSLMLLQSVLGMVVMFLPSLLEHRLKIDIPTFMEVAFTLFLYCAIFLGEVREYYYRVPHWDTILHTFSGLMIGTIGFSLVNILNKSNRMHISLSPGFVAIFAFSFAMAINAVWEVYEFTADELFGMNMQKFIPEQFLGDSTSAPLNGTIEEIGNFYRTKAGYKYALMDTMKDLIVDLIGAAAISIIGYVSLKMKKSLIGKLLVKNLVVDDGRGGRMPAEDESSEPIVPEIHGENAGKMERALREAARAELAEEEDENDESR